MLFFKIQKLFFLFLLLFFIFLFNSQKIFAINNWGEGYNIKGNQTLDVCVSNLSCYRVTNSNSSYSIFVPTKTISEWNTFISNKPSYISINSCSCASSANSCGQISYGTYNCSGVCSATTPANPSGYGSTCYSAYNDCGQRNTGTIGCSGACSATTPANPSYYGQGCSASNACGTNYGTYNCSGACSATTPILNYCGRCSSIVGYYATWYVCSNNCEDGSYLGLVRTPNTGCCASNYGQGCQSAPNCGGRTNPGTITCSGTCSATPPPDTYGYCDYGYADTWGCITCSFNIPLIDCSYACRHIITPCCY